ncbi:hypothetical protein pb186bvf_008091 [Paramecium bursaria]
MIEITPKTNKCNNSIFLYFLQNIQNQFPYFLECNIFSHINEYKYQLMTPMTRLNSHWMLTSLDA